MQWDFWDFSFNVIDVISNIDLYYVKESVRIRSMILRLHHCRSVIVWLVLLSRRMHQNCLHLLENHCRIWSAWNQSWRPFRNSRCLRQIVSKRQSKFRKHIVWKGNFKDLIMYSKMRVSTTVTKSEFLKFSSSIRAVDTLLM